jgi:signal peptidase I
MSVPPEFPASAAPEPDAPEPQAPDAALAQTPDAPEPQAPDAALAQTPDAPEPQAPDAALAQAPDAPAGPQSPDAWLAQAPDAPGPQARDAWLAQAPDAPGPQAPDAALAQARPRTRVERFRAWRFAPVVEVIATIAVALALAESVQAAVVKPFVIPSASMEPTLAIGQRVLVNRLAYDFSSPERGDIVVFHPPSSLTCAVTVPSTEPCPRSNSRESSQYFVKRVIGLPGDRIWIDDGHPVINGTPLWNEPYILPCVDSESCQYSHPMTVPRGEYFMLGDNRGDSDDSRFWGPIPGSWIIGEVFATYWPPDRIGLF